MDIHTNTFARYATMYMNINNNKLRKDLERLSSGYKINRAADDAAGLAISEQMRSRIRGLEQGTSNIEQGEGYFNVADGALNEISSMLIRMKKLAVQAVNGTYNDESRADIDAEVQELKKETEEILKNTEYNDIKIWDKDSQVEETIKIQTGSQTHPVSTSMTIELNSHSTTDKNSAKITNANRFAMPALDKTSYKFFFNADPEKGLQLTWNGINGNKYSSDFVPWPSTIPDDWGDDSKLSSSSQSYTINFGEYMKEYISSHPESQEELKGFDLSVTYNTSTYSTTKTVSDFFNDHYIHVYYEVPTYVSISNQSGNELAVSQTPYTTDNNEISKLVSNGEYVGGAYFDYEWVALADRDMEEHSDTSFLEPVNINNGSNKNNISYDKSTGEADGSLALYFNLNNVGRVQSVFNSANIFIKNDRTGSIERKSVSFSDGHHDASKLKSAVESALNDTTDMADSGNFIYIDYQLNTDEAFYYYYNRKYGTNISNDLAYYNTPVVGTFFIAFPIYKTDTVSSVFDKINNIKTIDFYSGDQNSDTGHAGQANYLLSGKNVFSSSTNVTMPQYEDKKIKHEKLIIQNSSIQSDKEEFTYEYLDNQRLGIDGLSTDTLDNAHDAISTIDNAIGIVNVQRAVFGAYTNRLEHVHSNNMNANENVTAAESRIRDTDMATEIASYSKNNIISQASMAMLAQANQSGQGVLTLLRG
ncbi:MAG: flagellin [Lachnospiraceae bacterium]|nr:flagellin [Lachnospiraceae bacterium]